MALGKRDFPDFVAGTVAPDTDPTDQYVSAVDLGQDFTIQTITVPVNVGK